MVDTASSRRALLALSLMVVIWGINFPIAKAAIALIPPTAFNALRFPLAALVVFVALRLRGPIPWPARADRRRVLALGLFGNVLYQQFFIFGLAHSSAGIASVLLAGTPVATTLLSAGAGHERVGLRTWAGVLLGFGGIALVIAAGRDPAQGGGSIAGNLIMLGAALAWSVYTVGSRDLVARYGPMPFTAWTLWTGSLVLVLSGLPAVLRLELATIPAAAWGGVVYAGTLSIGVAYLLWYYAVSRVGNAKTSAFSNLTPVVALASAALALGERPGAWQLVGAGVVIAGVLLTQLRVGR